jgi:hypothetical protein
MKVDRSITARPPSTLRLKPEVSSPKSSDDMIDTLSELFAMCDVAGVHPLGQRSRVHRASDPALTGLDRCETLSIEPDSPWENGSDRKRVFRQAQRQNDGHERYLPIHNSLLSKTDSTVNG